MNMQVIRITTVVGDGGVEIVEYLVDVGFEKVVDVGDDLARGVFVLAPLPIKDFGHDISGRVHLEHPAPALIAQQEQPIAQRPAVKDVGVYKDALFKHSTTVAAPESSSTPGHLLPRGEARSLRRVRCDVDGAAPERPRL